MKKIKNSFKADAVGNLYRSSLFLAKGNVTLALELLDKASDSLSEIKKRFNLSSLKKNQKIFSSKENQLYWAEKILDQYTFFKSKFLS